MILVYGPDELLAQEVVRHLQERGLPVTAVDADSHLFSEAVEKGATAIIGLLPQQPRVSEDSACEFVNELTQASTAPSGPRVVLVTPAPACALHLRLLRRSGAPYVVISSEELTLLPPSAYLPKRPVWVARDVLKGKHMVATQQALLQAVTEAVDEGAAVGNEGAPPRVGWDAALRGLGVRVHIVPAWLARLAALLRQPVVYLSPTGEVVVQLGYEEVARALGALPSGEPA